MTDASLFTTEPTQSTPSGSLDSGTSSHVAMASDDLSAKVAKIQAKAKSRSREQEPRHELSIPVQLPLLQPDERGMPNALARGALFNAAKSSVPRDYHKTRLVASLSNIRVEYSGQELRQDDCSVLIALLYFQQLQQHEQKKPIGEAIQFTAYAMLKELGWSHNKVEYAHLRECCDRLKATSLTVSNTDGSQGFAGSLLRSFAWKDDQQKGLSRWQVTFEPSIATFFKEASFSILDPEIRRKLTGRAPLAQWLHNFLNSHTEPYPYTVEKYMELTESRSKNIAEFRSRMKVALERLRETGFLIHWEIDKKSDTVRVTKAKVRHARPVFRDLNEVPAIG